MVTAVAPPLPFDWDALRTPAWHAQRARKQAVRADFAQAREAGLRRRHAVKLARVHAGCGIEPDGAVHCAVDRTGSGRCPRRFALIDPLDRPGVTEHPKSDLVLDGPDLVEELSHDDLLARLDPPARFSTPAQLGSPARSTPDPPPVPSSPARSTSTPAPVRGSTQPADRPTQPAPPADAVQPARHEPAANTRCATVPPTEARQGQADHSAASCRATAHWGWLRRRTATRRDPHRS